MRIMLKTHNRYTCFPANSVLVSRVLSVCCAFFVKQKYAHKGTVLVIAYPIVDSVRSLQAPQRPKSGPYFGAWLRRPQYCHLRHGGVLRSTDRFRSANEQNVAREYPIVYHFTSILIALSFRSYVACETKLNGNLTFIFSDRTNLGGSRELASPAYSRPVGQFT